MKIGSIVIHCYEFESMVRFWQQVLGYVPREEGSQDWIVLRDPNGTGPNLSFQKRQKRRDRKNWIHLDLYTPAQGVEVRRLESIGAKRHPWRYEAGADYVVMEDPDGNLFCVVQKESMESTKVQGAS